MSPLMHDRGRGPELRRIRITVNDLFPYFETGKFTDVHLLSVFSITQAELDALRDYIAVHREEVVEVNRRVDERIRREMEAQNTPEFQARFWWNEERRRAFLEWRRGRNGKSDGQPASNFVAELKLFRQWYENRTLGEIGATG